MALPVVFIPLLQSIVGAMMADTEANRDMAIARYKTNYLALKEKLNAKVELEKIEATKEIVLAMKDFAYAVFNKKIEYLQDSKEKISVLFQQQLEHLRQEKEKYEKKLFTGKQNADATTFLQKRIGEIDCNIIELNGQYKSSMLELNAIVASLSAPAVALNIAEIRKSVKLLEE